MCEHDRLAFSPGSSRSPRPKRVSPTLVVALVGVLTTFLAAFSDIDSRLTFTRPTPTPTAVSYPPRLVVASGFGSTYVGKPVIMLLVPAGEFSMGSEGGDGDEKPVHTVFVDDFYIDRYEVTNAQYAVCVEEGVCRAPELIGETYVTSRYYGDPRYDDYPVDTINWHMARTYCEWRGARLPTEAEWEKAARGADGRTYPWGEDIDCALANYRGCVGSPAPVGSYEGGRSVYGVYDLAGNVWEWVDSRFQNYPYTPDFDEVITWFDNRVVRGGSWQDEPEQLRAANRAIVHPWLACYYDTVGFRCARPAAP